MILDETKSANHRPLALPDLFDTAYVINLPERTDRLNEFSRQSRRVYWDLAHTKVNIFPALRFAEPDGFPSAAIRGCFQSHLACLRMAHQEGRKSVLILEDDIALSTSLPRLTPLMQRLLGDRRWDFVYFSHHFSHHGAGSVALAHRDTRESEFAFKMWTDELFAADFYAVSARILPRLIEHLERISNGGMEDHVAGPMPVDGAYNIFRRRNSDVRCLIATPRLGRQMSSRSDITPRAIDKIPLLRPVNGFLRKLKRMGSLWRF